MYGCCVWGYPRGAAASRMPPAGDRTFRCQSRLLREQREEQTRTGSGCSTDGPRRPIVRAPWMASGLCRNGSFLICSAVMSTKKHFSSVSSVSALHGIACRVLPLPRNPPSARTAYATRPLRTSSMMSDISRCVLHQTTSPWCHPGLRRPSHPAPAHRRFRHQLCSHLCLPSGTAFWGQGLSWPAPERLMLLGAQRACHDDRCSRIACGARCKLTGWPAASCGSATQPDSVGHVVGAAHGGNGRTRRVHRGVEQLACKSYGSAGRSTAGLLFSVRFPSPRQPTLWLSSVFARIFFFVYLGLALFPIFVRASLGATVFFPELIGAHTNLFFPRNVVARPPGPLAKFSKRLAARWSRGLRHNLLQVDGGAGRSTGRRSTEASSSRKTERQPFRRQRAGLLVRVPPLPRAARTASSLAEPPPSS